MQQIPGDTGEIADLAEAPRHTAGASTVMTTDEVEFLDGANIEPLRLVWAELEPQADISFFLSWGWIGSWLELVASRRRHVLAAVVRNANRRIIGVSLFGHARRLRRTLLPSAGYHLNEVGDSAIDCLTIEYNGLVAAPGDLESVAGATITALSTRYPAWDELVLSGLDSQQCEAFIAAAQRERLAHRLLYEKPSFYVDLQAVRASSGYLDALSQNTRYQVRRALRLYQADGDVTYEPARSSGEALAFLDGLKKLHQPYWQSRGQPGAFANPFFEHFHRNLITARFSAGEIELARVAVAGRALGYLYNFVHRGRVYSYQSGFQYEEDPKRKPGLVSHYLAIEHHIRAGARIYDFLAGDAQHKRSLATHDVSLAWVTEQRDRLRFRVEEQLRRWKHRWLTR